ncbi:MAG: hypothetical protein HYV59_09515 [Planctomycetes bacterium]|nr:hypothetical protein [Planctomycetota bacterium]
MKLYNANSYEEAAQMAVKDNKKWNEEERRQLGLIAGKDINKHLTNRGLPEIKRRINLYRSEDCRSFALEGEVYLFRNAAHGISIKKLLPSTLSQFSDEQLVNELRRREWNYIVTEINYDMVENRKIKTSSLI